MLKTLIECDAMELYGEEGGGEGGIKKLLNKLYWDDGITSTEIGNSYGVNKDTVLALMKKVGISAKAPKGGIYFIDALEICGYRDADDFFSHNSIDTKSDMAKELGVSYRTLCAHYTKWMESFE